jgi:hypothetical protein
MLTRRRFTLALAALGATWPVVANASAQKQPMAKTPNKLALAEEEVEQLLLLMDTDKNGKISKKEWLAFMEAEFDRLDTDRSGELDVKELAQSRLRASRHANTGK